MIFLISNSTCALLIYRKAINQLFYIYLLSCNLAIIAYLFQEGFFFSLFVNSFRFSTQTIMSSVNKDNFMSSFLICILVMSFCSFIALARTSSVVLRSGAMGHPCLVSDLCGESLSFTPVGMMLGISFLQIFFIKLGKFPCIPSLLKVLS